MIKDILFSLMTVSLTAGVVLMLCPEDNGGMKKTLGFVCSAVICASLVSPLVKAVYGIDRFSFPTVSAASENDGEYSNSAADAVIGEAVCAIRQQLEKEILEKYGRNVSVSIQLDSTDFSSVRIISATVSGNGDLDVIRDYVSDSLGCEVIISDGKGEN